jgi:PsaD
MAEELTGQTPIFGGSTGGLLTSADVEEKYAITWTSKTQQVFEMPTGGAAVMHAGENMLYPKLRTTKSTGFMPAAKPSTSIPRMVFSLRR